MERPIESESLRWRYSRTQSLRPIGGRWCLAGRSPHSKCGPPSDTFDIMALITSGVLQAGGRSSRPALSGRPNCGRQRWPRPWTSIEHGRCWPLTQRFYVFQNGRPVVHHSNHLNAAVDEYCSLLAPLSGHNPHKAKKRDVKMPWQPIKVLHIGRIFDKFTKSSFTVGGRRQIFEATESGYVTLNVAFRLPRGVRVYQGVRGHARLPPPRPPAAAALPRRRCGRKQMR